MKQITKQEANKLVDEGCGIANFMGGVGGDETKPFIEIVEDEYWLIERDEIESDEYKKIRKRQIEESKKYNELCDIKPTKEGDLKNV